MLTDLSVAWADSSTAISSWNGVSYSSSVVGFGLAACRRAKISAFGGVHGRGALRRAGRGPARIRWRSVCGLRPVRPPRYRAARGVGDLGGHQARVVRRQTRQARLMAAMALAADVGVLGGPASSCRHHVDAVDRTGRHAQITAGAPVGQHRVHALVGADDGVHRTGLDAERAADAMGLVDARHQQQAGLAARQVQRQDGLLQQRGQRSDAFIAAGRAAVDGGCAGGGSVGVGPAAVMAALGALRLRQ